MFPPSSPGVLSSLLLTLVASVVAAGCDPSSTTDEIVHLKVSGSCAQGVREFDMHQYQYTLGISYADAGPVVPFPRRGAIDGEGHPIREGGWQLWGCLGGNEPCFDTFRRCTARRESWQLDVTCLDGTGAVACQAVLTE